MPSPTRVPDTIEAHQVWVAEMAARPVGWVEVRGNQIEGLYVRPEQARQGLAAALLAQVEKQIESAGFRTVMLEASWNSARFYANRGYQPISERSAEGDV